jgi:CRP-like cAMP-binding protein
MLPPSNSFRNQILQLLPRLDVTRLTPSLVLIDLEVRTVIEEAQKPIEHVYFLEGGIASIVAVLPRGSDIEAGIIGRDGMTGIAVLLGDDRSPNETYMQVAGSGWRIRADDLRQALAASTTLQQILLRYVQAFLVQTAHSVLANGRAKLEERLARWLLMVRDRVDSDRLELTHEFLATMLGVRRPGVTEALHALEGKGVIKAVRAQVTIIDREGLEELAGGAYGVPEREYRRLMRQP